jgi:uncharacterized RDD family membrane protein YckC
MNVYYILEDGEQSGPFTFKELTEMDLDIHTRILSPLADTWQDACDLPEFYPYFEERGTHFPTEDNLATFWWRLLAYIIDSTLLGVLMAVVLRFFQIDLQKMTAKPDIALLKFELVVYGVIIIYNAVCEASPMQGSIGKKGCGLVVVDADGQRLTFFNALSRNLGKILSSVVFYIGFLNILWNEHKQAWHDILAKTYVVKL